MKFIKHKNFYIDLGQVAAFVADESLSISYNEEGIFLIRFWQPGTKDCISLHFTTEQERNEYLKKIEDILGMSEEKGGEKENEWQPIETAPKDGAVILACTGGSYPCIICVWWDTRRDVWRINGSLAQIDSYFHAPTHWMPLPKPPKEVKDDK